MSSDYQLEDTLYLPFTTRAFATGIPTALVSGAVDIYEDVTATPIVTGETLTVSLNSVAGFNMITVTATAASGFEAGKSYTAILQAGTVDSVSVVGEVVAHFTIEMSAAALDLANGTDGLGAIKAETALIVADTNELQTDDVPGLIATAQADLDTITGSDGVTLATAQGLYAPAKAGDSMALTAAAVDAIIDETLTSHVTADSLGVAIKDILADTNELQTDDIPTTLATLATTAELNKVPKSDGTTSWNATALGDINTQADTALTDYDPPTRAELTTDINSVITDLDDIKGTGFVKDTHSLVDIEAYVDLIDDGTSGLAKIATDVAAILVDTNELQTDDVPGLIAALENIAASDVLTQVNAALDTAISELSQGVPTATPSLRTGLMLLYMALRNKVDVQTSGTDSLEIHNDAGTRIAQKLVTDDGSDYSEAKMITGA